MCTTANNIYLILLQNDRYLPRYVLFLLLGDKNNNNNVVVGGGDVALCLARSVFLNPKAA